MKRYDLVQHLLHEGCVLVREGAKHSVFFNPALQRSSTVPRHKEINAFLSKKVCRDLSIELPKRR